MEEAAGTTGTTGGTTEKNSKAEKLERCKNMPHWVIYNFLGRQPIQLFQKKEFKPNKRDSLNTLENNIFDMIKFIG
jgi:hypothetical protein